MHCKLLALFFMAFLLALVQSKPVEEMVVGLEPAREMMETAEAQNPFLPRFAMKKLKERREQAQAARRNGHAQARGDGNQRRKPCPNGYRYPYYGKK